MCVAPHPMKNGSPSADASPVAGSRLDLDARRNDDRNEAYASDTDAIGAAIAISPESLRRWPKRQKIRSNPRRDQHCGPRGGVPGASTDRGTERNSRSG